LENKLGGVRRGDKFDKYHWQSKGDISAVVNDHRNRIWIADKAHRLSNLILSGVDLHEISETARGTAPQPHGHNTMYDFKVKRKGT
jgi:hypothetical protein